MGIKLEIDQEVALRIIDSDIKFLDKYYTKRLAELKEEFEAIEKKMDIQQLLILKLVYIKVWQKAYLKVFKNLKKN